jgi:polysaccharide biosynthesis protein PslG
MRRPFRIALVCALAAVLGVGLSAASAASTTAQPSSAENMWGVAAGASTLYYDDATLARYLDAMKNLGIRYIRADFPLNGLFPTSLQAPQWAPYDRYVAAVHARGMEVLPILGHTPAWARASSSYNGGIWTPWADDEAFGEACRKIVERYRPLGVRTYELWNEPNVAGFFGVDGTGRNVDDRDVLKYAGMVKAAYRAMKAEAADITVLAGTAGIGYYPNLNANLPSMDSLLYLQKLYDPSLGNWKGHFDGLSFHAYPDFSRQKGDEAYAYAAGDDFVGWNKLDETTPSVRGIMAQYGDSDKKVWVTEFGAPTTPSGAHTTEEGQRQIAEQVVRRWRSKPYAGGLMWYTGMDSGTSRTDSEEHFGLLRHDWSAKPAYDSFRNAIASSLSSASSAAPQPPGAARTASPPNAPCRVPGVVGLRLAVARARIKARGCRVGRVRRARPARIARVLSQQPRRGARRQRGARIALTVARP